MGSGTYGCKRGARMKILDLGDLRGRVVLFGGAYSNLQALRALVAWVRAEGIPAQNVICTGDVVGYCANPEETVALIRELGWPVIAGNVERQLAEGAEDCGCGFEDGTTCDILSRGWYPFAARHVSENSREWMRGLPDRIIFSHNGRRFAVLHGGADDISAFVWPTTEDSVFRREVALLTAQVGQVDAVIAGHCGLPFQREVDGNLWVNAGIIGMPPNDGRPATRFAVLGKGLEFRELDYPHNEAAKAMRNAGLTQGYELALSSGYWPSEDILPAELRRKKTA